MKKVIIFFTLCTQAISLTGSAPLPLYTDVKKDLEEVRDVKQGQEKKTHEEKQARENPSMVKTQELPIKIAFSPNGNIAVVANKKSDTLSIYHVDNQRGKFTSVAGSPFKTEGNGPSSVTFSPNGELTAVINKYSDTVSLYHIDNQTGNVTSISGSPLNTQGQPRAVAFFPKGPFVAIINGDGNYNESNTVNIYKIDYQTKSVTPIAESTLKIGEERHPSSIAFSPNGNFAGIANMISNTISMYHVNNKTGSLIAVEGSPFKTTGEPDDITFSPDGNFVATPGTFSGNAIHVYRINNQTGILTSIPGSPFKTGKFPTQIVFSPHGNIAAVTNMGDNTVSVYLVDHQTGQLTEIAGSPFKTGGKTPESIAFSPNLNIAAITNKGNSTISIFEVNQQTGAFRPITGDILELVHARLAQQEVHKVLIESGPLTNEEENIISHYLGASAEKSIKPTLTQEQINYDIKEDKGEIPAPIKAAMDKTRKERYERILNKDLLFAAIHANDFDKFNANLTPFTVNAKNDAPPHKTPLMEAAHHGYTNMVQRLIEYQGIIQDTCLHKKIIHSEFDATDQLGNTALIIAVREKQFAIARMIAERMTLSAINMANQMGVDAYTIAIKYADTHEKNPDYKILLTILEQAHKH